MALREQSPEFDALLEQVEDRYSGMIADFLEELDKRSIPISDYAKMTAQQVNWGMKIKSYIAYLMNGESLQEAALRIQVSTGTISSYRKNFKTFNALVSAAYEDGFALFEREARRRSVDGVRTYVVSGGKVVLDPATGEPLTEQKYSDSLLMFVMKGRDPGTYRERSDVNLTGQLNLTGARDTLLEKLAPVLGALLQDDEEQPEEIADQASAGDDPKPE